MGTADNTRALESSRAADNTRALENTRAKGARATRKGKKARAKLDPHPRGFFDATTSTPGSGDWLLYRLIKTAMIKCNPPEVHMMATVNDKLVLDVPASGAFF